VKLLDIAINLYNHYESLTEVKNYYGQLAIYGLCRTAEVLGDAYLLERCRRILRPFLRGEVAQSINFQLYRIGGVPSAYMLMRGHLPEAREAVVYEVEKLIHEAPRAGNGIFCHPRYPGEERIWIDVCLAVTPFLLFAGLAEKRDDYIDEAVAQTVKMYDLLLDRECGLLHQCYNFAGPGLFSQDHWGRGNGWGLLGLTELVQYLPPHSPHRAGVEKRFAALVAALLRHQSPSGMWCQEVPDPTSYEESSATGLIAYGLGVGLRLGVLPAVVRQNFRRAMRGLAGCIGEDGSIQKVCIGCLYPGDLAAYKAREKRTDDPHGFGPAMLALTEAVRQGWYETADILEEGP